MIKLSKFIINTKKESEEIIFIQSLSYRKIVTPAKKLKKQKKTEIQSRCNYIHFLAKIQFHTN